MPIIIPKDIPAFNTLQRENIFVIEEKRAVEQDIRPIEIAILNLMPTKVETETQLIRLLSNSALQVNVTLLSTASYVGKNTSLEHLHRFYKTFNEVKDNTFDGMIITGAPVETLPFEQVKYWEELKEIMEYAREKVTSTMYICWGAQAALYYYYSIDKHLLPEKLFGIFEHKKMVDYELLLKGVDDLFYVPHSRHTTVNAQDILKVKDLLILGMSDKAGVSIIKSLDNRFFFITGHMEYDRYTLKTEYERDLKKKLPISEPYNYFSDKDKSSVNMNWNSTANLVFSNWLNYYVYQVTPYEIEDVNNKNSK